jgi:hypothetical protein
MIVVMVGRWGLRRGPQCFFPEGATHQEKPTYPTSLALHKYCLQNHASHKDTYLVE